jgi:hypothetical protein
MNNRPQYLITYQCKSCGEQSRFVENEEPYCRNCQKAEDMEEILKEEITPELMEEQLKSSMERTFKNLQSAFESMTDEDKAAFGDADAEKEMLMLLARAKKLKEHIDQLNLKEPEEGEK